MFYLLYCPTDLLFFNIPLLHYYIDRRSSIVCSLLSVNICLSFSFFYHPQYFMFLNYYVANFLKFYLQLYYGLNRLLLLLLFKLFFWNSFNCIYWKFFSIIEKFLAVFSAYLYFYPYFWQNTIIHSILYVKNKNIYPFTNIRYLDSAE